MNPPPLSEVLSRAIDTTVERVVALHTRTVPPLREQLAMVSNELLRVVDGLQDGDIIDPRQLRDLRSMATAALVASDEADPLSDSATTWARLRAVATDLRLEERGRADVG